MEVKDDDQASWTVASSSRREDRKARQEAARQLHVTRSLEKTQKCLQGTERNADTAPLLCLPGELRNKIYAYVLEEQEHNPYSRPSYVIRGRTSAKTLRCVCRQIRYETDELPRESDFCLQMDQPPDGRLEKILDFHRFPDIRFDRVSLLEIQTFEYTEWKCQSSGDDFAYSNFGFLAELPNLTRIHVTGEFLSEEDVFGSDHNQQKLTDLLRRYKTDVKITFQTQVEEDAA